MLIDQFERLRDGDPFWSQNSDLPPEELEALWSTKLSDLIERNTDIDPMQDNAFLAYDRIGGGEAADRLTGADGRDLMIGLGGKGPARWWARATTNLSAAMAPTSWSGHR